MCGSRMPLSAAGSFNTAATFFDRFSTETPHPPFFPVTNWMERPGGANRRSFSQMASVSSEPNSSISRDRVKSISLSLFSALSSALAPCSVVSMRFLTALFHRASCTVRMNDKAKKIISNAESRIAPITYPFSLMGEKGFFMRRLPKEPRPRLRRDA